MITNLKKIHVKTIGIRFESLVSDDFGLIMDNDRFFLCRDTSCPCNKAMCHTPITLFKLIPKTQLFIAVSNNKVKEISLVLVFALPASVFGKNISLNNN